ncbi:hypothetical protein, partial [Actinomadura roseirufa]|uniref:hypothetical protein n=1 Tax=Actinomadura roseirufa TaxID=2094049 RepID=UPI001A954DBF
GSSGLLATVGTKTAAVIAGTALVGGTAGGVGVYRATRPERPHAAAAESAPSPAGAPLRIGRLTVRAPAGWKAHRITYHPTGGAGRDRPGDGYYVATSATCAGQDRFGGARPSASECKGFFVLGPSFIDDPSSYIANGYRGSDTYASLFSQDEGMSCPGHEKLRAVGVRYGARLTANRLAGIGPRNAEYREWSVPCYTRGAPEGYGPTDRTRFSYTERLWYLPTSKVLVVDLWNTPGLERILKAAAWA